MMSITTVNWLLPLLEFEYIFAVQFLIGGLVYLCNGRPALKLNRDYTQLEEISTSGSSQSSASNSVTEKQGSGSDNELWEETSKLIEELPHS